MGERSLGLALLALSLLLTTAAGQSSGPRKVSVASSRRGSARVLSEQQIARIALASLVSITAHIEAAELSRNRYGTGFFIDGGLIVTCHHLVAYASTLKIQPIASARAHVAVVSSSNEETDLAVLRTSDGFVVKPLALARALPVVGERIYVASNPRGFAGTFAAGNVSGYRKFEGGRLLMQISAPISPGSSGGAVLNSKAQVVGIISASREDAQNLNFAVPVTALGLAILDDLLEEAEKRSDGTGISKDDPYGLLKPSPARKKKKQ